MIIDAHQHSHHLGACTDQLFEPAPSLTNEGCVHPCPANPPTPSPLPLPPVPFLIASRGSCGMGMK